MTMEVVREFEDEVFYIPWVLIIGVEHTQYLVYLHHKTQTLEKFDIIQ